MKKPLLFLLAVSCAGASIGQLSTMQHYYEFAPSQKHAEGAITTLPNRTAETGGDRAVYYSQDFDAGLDGWTTEIIEGPVGFELTNVGHENDPENTFQIPVLATTTPTQWIVLDSDGDNDSYANAEEATLTSPELDLSAAVGGFVALKFEQFFAEWQPAETEDHCYIGISTNGVDFEEIEINEGVGREARANPELIAYDITDMIAGEEENVWIRFRWTGAWNYGWQIDNVQIEDIQESDLEIGAVYRTYDEGIVYSQIAIDQAAPMIIGAIIKNVGHIDQTNIGFDYEITGPAGTVVSSGSATEFIAGLANGEQDTLLIETGYTPDALGNYEVSWTATSDAADDDMSNNTATDDYLTITEHTMALDYDKGPVAEIGNWPLKIGQAWFGNLMQFQTADVATAMEIKITDYTLNQGNVINGAVWGVPEGGADWILLTTTDDYEIKPGDLGNFVTLDMEAFEVDATTLYLFCAAQYGSSEEPMFERQGDIGFNNIQGRDDELLNRGFFDRLAPIVRVRFNEGEVSLAESETEVPFGVFPNPATDELTIRTFFNDAQPAKITITAISGNTVQSIDLGTVSGGLTTTVDLSELAEGVYFVTLSHANDQRVKRVVVQ